MCILLNDADTAEEWLSRMVNRVSLKTRDKQSDNFSAIAIMNCV